MAALPASVPQDLSDRPLRTLLQQILDALGNVSAIKSIQSVYSSQATTNSSGEDLRFIDVTVAAVTDTTKCYCYAAGTVTATTNYSGAISARMTSTTNVRLSTQASGASNIAARVYVVEYA